MSTLRSLGISLLVYATLSFFFFGDIFGPMLTSFSDRLGAPLWPVLIAISIACAAYAVSWADPPEPAMLYRAPAFVGLTLVISVILVGLYAERIRRQSVAEFKPDSYISSSFFRSLREAPSDFQFFLHAAALKDCTPYAWSYREMAFYQLPPNVAVNVLPREWIKRCAIERTSR